MSNAWQSANGKVILFGEHAVFYGVESIAGGVPDAVRAKAVRLQSGVRSPAISIVIPAWGVALTLDPAADFVSPEKLQERGAALILQTFAYIVQQLRLQEHSFELELDARIPPASGLGGSAALAVASVRALSAEFELALCNERVNELAFGCETLAHGRPSGLDNTLATFGGLLSFCRGSDGSRAHFSALTSAQPIPLIVALSGKKGFTAETVERVRIERTRNRTKYDNLFTEIAAIVTLAKAALADGNLHQLAELMNRNQSALAEIGVSCKEIDRVIDIALDAGALGAKLTGSGDGGAVIIYAGAQNKAVHERLRHAGFETRDIVLGEC